MWTLKILFEISPSQKYPVWISRVDLYLIDYYSFKLLHCLLNDNFVEIILLKNLTAAYFVKAARIKATLMKKKTLVLGASMNPGRYSNLAIQRLTSYKQPTVAVGLRNGEVAGVSITKDKENFEDVDTVTLYLNPQRQKEYYGYILSLEPNRVIFNPGTENPELYAILRENNIEVEVACTLIMLATNQY